jgi:hypothetical protein
MNTPKFPLPSWILPTACVFMALGLLSIGLWPFNPYKKNDATWLPSGKGLRFGGHGVSFTPTQVMPQGRTGDDSFCSLRVQVQPAVTSIKITGTILGFYTPEIPLRFRLLQYNNELLIRKDYRDANGRLKMDELELEHAFQNIEPVTFIITSSNSGTAAYRNGEQVGISTHMKMSCADFAGQLVLGDSPVTQVSWQGSMLDLAVYEGALTPQQISRESVQLNQSGSSLAFQMEPSEKVIAHFAFKDGSGKIVRNLVGSAPDLQIPDYFRTVHRQMLVWPWQESSDKLAVVDIAINILGFVPFGLLLSAYLSISHVRKRSILVSVLAGFAVSVTIEVLQAFIPSRGSGLLDIVTNTFGTYLGALLFQWPPIRNIASKFYVYPA